MNAVAASSTTNTVNLIHAIIVLFLQFGVVICGIAATVQGLLERSKNCMHSGGVEKAINFGGFGSVPVVAYGTIGSSAVSEREAIGIDVERCRRICAGRFRVDGDIIIELDRAVKAFWRSQAASATSTGVRCGVLIILCISP